MPKSLSRDAFFSKIGSTLGHSDWVVVGQDRIDAFCETTGDFQFIHSNPERAKDETPFGGAIAHGFLSLSLISQMHKETVPAIQGHEVMINYGLNRVRFLAPVRAGKRLRGHFTLKAVNERKPGQYLCETETRVEIEGEEVPALICTWLTLLIADKV